MGRVGEKNHTKISYFDINYSSSYDGPGIRLVLFLQSCNADCIWCHSPHSKYSSSPLLFTPQYCSLCALCQGICEANVHQVQGGKHILKRENCIKCGKCIKACPNSSVYKAISALKLPTIKKTVTELFKEILPQLKMLKNIGGITLSGGEALLQKKAVIELLRLCKVNNINTTVETSGLLPVHYYEGLGGLVDYWLFGMRFTTNYPKENHSEAIYNSIKIIKTYGKEILPRIPAIPNHTDSNWYLNKCSELLHNYKINKVFISPWNMNTGHYYRLSGIEETMKMPSVEDSNRCESIIKNHFRKEKITIEDIVSYNL